MQSNEEKTTRKFSKIFRFDLIESKNPYVSALNATTFINDEPSNFTKKWTPIHQDLFFSK